VPADPQRIGARRSTPPLAATKSKAKHAHKKQALKIDEERVAALSERSTYLSTQASAHSGCMKRKHSIQLFGDAPADSALSDAQVSRANELARRTYAPTLHEPGAYGSWSSAVCFNASSLFVDQNGSSMHRNRYYFQSEVVVMPTEKRRGGTAHGAHRTFESFERVALGTADEARLAPDTERTVRYVRTPPTQLTSPQLGTLLKTLDASKTLERFHTAQFDISLGKSRSELRLYGYRQNVPIAVIFVVLFLSVCIAASVLACLSASKKRANGSAAKSDPKPNKKLVL
jgi:hypothetical protein